MTRTAARFGCCRSVSNGWSSEAEDASAESTRVISRAYGLDASTRAWARTMRAPAISSCAEKIFFVDWVERMRRRSARREAATSAPLHLDGLLTALGRLHGLGLGLVEAAALARRELAVELLDRLLEGGCGVVAELLGGADLVVHARVGAAEEVEELALEAADVGHRHLVQLAGGAQPDRDDLALHRV